MYCHVLPCIAMYCHVVPCIAMIDLLWGIATPQKKISEQLGILERGKIIYTILATRFGIFFGVIHHCLPVFMVLTQSGGQKGVFSMV
jgi:hypothetical protein